MLRTFLSLLCLLSFQIIIAQPYQVGHRTEDIDDASRSGGIFGGPRTIDTEIYYPANTAGDDVPFASGTFPVIVFGHGFVTRWDNYDYLWIEYVSRGYVCVFPRSEGGLFPNHTDFALDLAYLANEMQVLNLDSVSPYFGQLTDRTAIMGHSMGGGCTLLAAENNNNITTVITMGAAETNPSAIAAAANITVPSLTIAGEEDCVSEPNTDQYPMFQALNSDCKFYMEIIGGGHCNFASGTATNCNAGEAVSCIGYGPFIAKSAQNQLVLTYTNPWLDFWLKDSCGSFSTFNQLLDSATTLSNWERSCIPTIVETAGTLDTDSAQTWQWYLDGNPITGGTQQMFTPLVPGTYEVEVTLAGANCPLNSQTYVLSDCLKDSYEPNDMPTQATFVGTQLHTQFNARICPAYDVDYYAFEVAESGLRTTISLSELTRNYQLELYNAGGNLIGSSNLGGTQAELIQLNSLSPGTYLLKVSGDAEDWDPVNDYQLSIQSVKPIASGGGKAPVTSGPISSGSLRQTLSSTILYPNPSKGNLTIALPSEPTQALQLIVVNQMGQIVYRHEDGIVEREIKLRLPEQLNQGYYFLLLQDGAERHQIKFWLKP